MSSTTTDHQLPGQVPSRVPIQSPVDDRGRLLHEDDLAAQLALVVKIGRAHV